MDLVMALLPCSTAAEATDEVDAAAGLAAMALNEGAGDQGFGWEPEQAAAPQQCHVTGRCGSWEMQQPRRASFKLCWDTKPVFPWHGATSEAELDEAATS